MKGDWCMKIEIDMDTRILRVGFSDLNEGRNIINKLFEYNDKSMKFDPEIEEESEPYDFDEAIRSISENDVPKPPRKK